MRLTLTRAAMWFGIIMLAVGILGFIPGVTDSNDQLFHFIQVGFWPNIVHLIIGAVALAVAGAAESARLFFQVVALFYLITFIIGLFIPHGQVWGFMNTNWWTELARAIVVLMAGSYAWNWLGDREILTTRRAAPTFGERIEERRNRR